MHIHKTCAALVLLSPLAFQANYAGSDTPDVTADVRRSKAINAVLKNYTVQSTLQENPSEIPEAVKIEAAINRMLHGSADIGLSNEDLNLLNSRHRGTEEGARLYYESVQKKSMDSIAEVCGRRSVELANEGGLHGVLASMSSVEAQEAQNAKSYWDTVISQLSSHGRNEFQANYASLAGTPGRPLVYSRVDWVSFGDEYPDYAVDLVERICARHSAMGNATPNFEPAERIQEIRITEDQ